PLGARFAESVQLERAADQAAGVDRVVGGIQDPAPFELGPELFGLELMIRAARDDLAAQPRQRVFVDHRAQRAWREHGRFDIVDLRHRHGFGAELIDEMLDSVFGEVGDEDLRAGGAQELYEVIPDLAGTLYREAHALEVTVTMLEFEARLDSVQRAER